MHLDGAFEKLSPEKAAARRKATRLLLNEIVALAKEQRVDLVFCTGDLFDGPTPYYDTIEAAAAAFAALDVPVFLAPGNHDWFDARSPYASVAWSGNVHIFQSFAPAAVELPQLNCRVFGIGYTQKRPPSPRALEGFRAPNDGRLNLLLGHGEVAKAGEYLVFFEEDIEKSNLHYVALGHVHRPLQTKIGQTLLVQNGSVEGHGFDEPGEKGVFLVEISENGGAARQIPLPGSRCVPVSLDVTALCALPEPEKAAAEEAIRRAEAVCPQERAFLRLELTGTGEISEQKIRQQLDDFLAVKLVNAVRPPVSPFAKAEEDSLTGLFVRAFKEKYEKAPDAEKENILLALSFGLAALENREEPYVFRVAPGEGRPV